MLAISPPPRSRATQPAHVVMTLSKISNVTFAVSSAGTLVSHTTLLLGHGRHSLVWRPPHAGAWMVALTAVDLAGNRSQASAPVAVLPAPPRHRHHSAHG